MTSIAHTHVFVAPIGMTNLLSEETIAKAVHATDDLMEHLTHIARRKFIRRYLREWNPEIVHEIQARWDARRLNRATDQTETPARVGRL